MWLLVTRVPCLCRAAWQCDRRRLASLAEAQPGSRYPSQLTEEEKRVINRRFEYDGEEGQVEMLCGRRKSKKTYEYEVKWVGRRENKNSWITREKCAASLQRQNICFHRPCISDSCQARLAPSSSPFRLC